MCEVLDRIIEQGRTEGIAQGMTQGMTRGKKEQSLIIAGKMLDDGLDINVISKYTLLSVEEINNIIENKKA